jgi:DNA-binding transcriptional LysR family regulator
VGNELKLIPGYKEEQLVSNRAAVVVWGAGEADRRDWAAEAAWLLDPEVAVHEVTEPTMLLKALGSGRGVVYVPDASGLPGEVQRELVRALREKEERPKVVLGLSGSPDQALSKGQWRDDLHFAFSRGRVDLGNAEVKAARAKRRKKSKR